MEYDPKHETTITYDWIEHLEQAKARVDTILQEVLAEGLSQSPKVFNLVSEVSFLLGFINSIKWKLEARNESNENETE